MTYRQAQVVAKRARIEFRHRCLIIPFAKHNWCVVTELAYYYDKETAHNQLFGTPQPQQLREKYES